MRATNINTAIVLIIVTVMFFAASMVKNVYESKAASECAKAGKTFESTSTRWSCK